jgi:hypothetical protein
MIGLMGSKRSNRTTFVAEGWRIKKEKMDFVVSED